MFRESFPGGPWRAARLADLQYGPALAISAGFKSKALRRRSGGSPLRGGCVRAWREAATSAASFRIWPEALSVNTEALTRTEASTPALGRIDLVFLIDDREDFRLLRRGRLTPGDADGLQQDGPSLRHFRFEVIAFPPTARPPLYPAAA
jgi:hypothetical protein